MRPLFEIAREIKADFKYPANQFAEPYIDAMLQLATLKDHFGWDSGEDIVLRFLCNASSWRGETARRVKAELNSTLKNT